LHSESLEIDKLPVESELLTFQPFRIPCSFPSTLTDVDESQREAIKMALSQRLSLIQGPPGTGKTFVGGNIIRCLLTGTDSKILVLSYTHHALDNLLENLISKQEVSKSDIVRFGNPNKVSEALQDCCFRQTEREFVSPFSRQDRTTKIDLNEQIASLSKEVDESAIAITSKQVISSSSMNEVQDILTSDEKDQFQSNEDWFKKWINNKTPKDIDPQNDSLWKLDKNGREQKKKEWWSRLAGIDELLEKVEELNNLKKELSCLRKVYEVNTIMEKRIRILACTTSYAIMHRDVIDSYCPTVMFVEEAGQIHESHILTNISSQIKQLIMIGDHKQLKPKLENYKLRTESNYGIDFDVSLFERLVKNNYPFATLNVQHRMIPEISQFVRQQTYPELTDAAGVMKRDGIVGSPSNILFIHHEVSEGSSDKASAISLADNSKVNEYEASFCLKLVEYFLQQGYDSDDIVILTPYLGQLVSIRNLMETSSLKAKLNSLDFKELKYFDYDLGDYVMCVGDSYFSSVQQNSKIQQSSKKKGKKENNVIRVCTIDNFQGEQSRIVIVSLVRSNDRGNIGFMNVPERVNVLMSRAQDGLFIVGNAKTYSRSDRKKNLWVPIIQTFHERKAFVGCFSAFDPTIKNIAKLFNPPESIDLSQLTLETNDNSRSFTSASVSLTLASEVKKIGVLDDSSDTSLVIPQVICGAYSFFRPCFYYSSSFQLH
jgi:hypothetical protein